MPSSLFKICLSITLFGGLCSCNYFDTQKIQEDTFYQQEVETIDWESVDQYPAFPDCETYTEKLEQRSCFQNTLLAHLYHDMSERQMELLEETRDTVWVDLKVSNAGTIESTNVVACAN